MDRMFHHNKNGSVRNPHPRTRKMVICAMVAAIYATVTLVLAPISYGNIQVRVAECMTLLPFFAPYTAWGLFAGCLIANVFSPLGFNILDVVFGSLATLVAALITSKVKRRALAPLPPVVINALVIGAVLAMTMVDTASFWPTFLLFALEIGAGQALSCYILGPLLLALLEKTGVRKLLNTN